jgi:hypothetical protein
MSKSARLRSNTSIELAANSMFQIKTTPGGHTERRRIAKPIRLRAIGEREDGVTVAQIQFRTRRGHNLREFFSWSDLLPENRKAIKDRLADLGYEWPGDGTLSQAILDALEQSRPNRTFRLVRAPGWYGSVFAIPGQAFALETLKKYKRQFEYEAAIAGAHNAHYRVRSNFAVMYAAAALAIDYGILPWGKSPTFRAIEKCMRLALEMLETGKAQAASPVQKIDLLRVANTVKKHMARAVILPVKPKQKVTAEQARARRNADGFKINGQIYVKPERFKSWVPAQSERDALKAHRILVTERSDTATVEKKIGGIEGKPRYYAVNVHSLQRLV